MVTGDGAAAPDSHQLAASYCLSDDYRLTVGAYNCEGFLSAFEYITDQVLPSCDILVLSESWLSRSEESYAPRLLAAAGHDTLQVFQSFTMETPPGAGEGRRRGGMALICRRSPGLTFRHCVCDNPRLCGVSALVNGQPVLNVIGCYMPYWDGDGGNSVEYNIVTAELEAVIAAMRPSAPVILAGDFNCALPQLPAVSRPLQWHRLRGFTQHSVSMQDLLDHNELAVAEFMFPQPVDFTYTRGDCQSHIDHIAVPCFLLPRVVDCQILPQHPENLSPHLPLVCQVSVAAAAPAETENTAAGQAAPASSSEVFCWDRADKIVHYRQALAGLLDNQLPACGDSLDALDATISRCLLSAAREAGCAKKRCRPKPWWSPVTAAARNRVRFWLRIWTSCGRPLGSAVHDCYQTARRKYRRARRAAALAPVQQEARLLHRLRRDGNVTGFWRRVQRARRGPLPSGTSRTASEFGNHFEMVHHDDCTQLDSEQSQLAASVEARAREAREAAGPRTVSPDQVAGLLRRLPLGKAPGMDGVTAEHLVHGCSPTLLAALARLLSASLTACDVPVSFSESVVVPLLKKPQLDPNCLDNYRPISLTTCVSKLLEMLVLDELETNFTPHALQLGFASRRGTTEASILASETVQWNRQRGLPVYAANLDARKCFDKIWHDGLFKRLVTHLCPSSWLLMLTWYRRLTAHVAFHGAISSTFRVRRGTRQGAILSPIFANVYLYPLVAAIDESGLGADLFGHHVPAICYADDLLLISTSVKDLGAMLRLVGNFGRRWRLEFIHPDPSRTKSHCIVFGAELLIGEPKWSLSGQELRNRQQSEHLGVVLDGRLSAAPHVRHRTARARASLYGLAPAGMLSPGLCPADKCFLWKTVVQPALTYGCVAAPLSSADVSELMAIQASTVKVALGLPRRAHHTALLAAAEIAPAHELVRAASFRAVHCALMSEQRLREALLSGLAKLAMCPSSLGGSLLTLLLSMCGGVFSAVLEVAAGREHGERVTPPRAPDGLVDTLRYLLRDPSQASRHLIRLLTCPDACEPPP